MSDIPHASHRQLGLTWVGSMGGPLVVVPVSALHRWGGCTPEGVIVGGTDRPDDYDRACAVEGSAEVIGLGGGTASALVLGDEPAATCYLSERKSFLRWFAADSDVELLAAAEAALDDPSTPWEECGVWETDGPAVLMDSAEAGSDLGVPYPTGGGQPDEAPVPLPAGRWRVRAFCENADSHRLGVVQLLPESGPQPPAP
ncbi:Imm21 family immunity protein [Kitasatospora sp. NPDC101447]|uniref:Imm21 family immunity protein n=1 Tax=Kitasatospora sp. NPDC101447 TaxID=3364102 RepID=UPI00382C24E2